MKKFTLVILIFAIVLTLSGCVSDKEVVVNVPEPSQTTPGKPVETKPPHSFGDFKGANQSFSGGGRRVPHPSFYRMVFEFTLGENSTQRAEAVPAYQITMNNDQTQITMDLPGVSWAEAVKNKEAIISSAPLLKDIQFQSKAQGGGQIQLSLQQKAVFQVFDLPNPSRIVIVMNPTRNARAE